MMSKIDELRWLIEQEKEKGSKLDRQMSAECKLLAEEEAYDCIIKRGVKEIYRRKMKRRKRVSGNREV